MAFLPTTLQRTYFNCSLIMIYISQRNRIKRGFTLVELLVVIVIAGIILSIAIPRLRIINKERNLREAARVVGSAFANASQRAVSDGVAGVRITRNPNFVTAGGLPFAATEVSLLRSVPDYVGDQAWQRGASLGATGSGSTVQIPMPIEHDASATPPRLIVEAGDEISFNNSSIRFRINNVTANGGSLSLALDVVTNAYPSLPTVLNDVPYVIHRRPRILRSSTTELPNGTIIDLRYSGFEANDPANLLSTVFEPAPTDLGGLQNFNIDVIFAEDGSVDRVFYLDPNDRTNVTSRVPIGPLSLFVIESPTDLNTSLEAAISDEQALWVSVSSIGTTNIGNNDTNVDVPENEGLTEEELSNLYNDDRDRFNRIMINARDNSLSTSAAQ